MKLVLDNSCLGTPKRRELVESFLRKSRENKVVMTEYLSKETFSAPDTATVRNQLALFGRFPGQTIVLKPNYELAQLRTRTGRNLQQRMTDETETDRLARYAAEAARGGRSIVIDILHKSGRAHDHVTDLVLAAVVVRNRIAADVAGYSPSELNILRKRQEIPEEFGRKIMANILNNAKSLFGEMGFLAQQLPDHRQVLFSFPFRFSLSLMFLEIFWVSKGRMPEKPERLRNFFTDMTYVANATYFDGLLSADDDMKTIYIQANHMIRDYLELPSCS